MKIRSIDVLRIMLVGSTCAVSTASHAALMLAATVNGGNVCAVDGNTPCSFGTQVTDLSPGADGMLVIGSPGDPPFNGVLISGSVQRSIHGNPDILDSSSLSVKNTTNSTVHILVAVGDTDFTQANSFFTSGSGSFQLSQGSTLTQRWYLDTSNGQGGLSTASTPGTLIDTFTVTATTPAFSFSHNGGPFAINAPGPYSMTLYYEYDLLPGGSIISRGQQEIATGEVPEPASITLFGLAGLGLWCLQTKRRRNV